jgi:hypothetical protein
MHKHSFVLVEVGFFCNHFQPSRTILVFYVEFDE